MQKLELFKCWVYVVIVDVSYALFLLLRHLPWVSWAGSVRNGFFVYRGSMCIQGVRYIYFDKVTKEFGTHKRSLNPHTYLCEGN